MTFNPDNPQEHAANQGQADRPKRNRNVGKCRSCGEWIYWAEIDGRKRPFNTKREYVLVPDNPDDKDSTLTPMFCFTVHFERCKINQQRQNQGGPAPRDGNDEAHY